VTPLGVLDDANYHITCTYGDGNLDVYTNGVLEAGATNSVAPASAAGYNFAGLGHSPYADPGINGSVDEFRIYQGRLSPQEIQASDALGPNATLSTASPSMTASTSAGNVTLSWPVANGGFWVQASPSLKSPNWTTITNVPALAGGTTWQVTVPKSSAVQFFRLWR
jgi:Concanavalin A-like lectin/glucanases superfamily